MKILKYAGPPGTGKSTTLLNIVDGLLSKQIPPEDIVFTTFTRAGAHEAKERAITRFNLPPSRLPYFKTIHSLCYSLLNDQRSLMNSHDWCEIATQLGLYFSVRINEDGAPKGATKGDAMLSLWSLSRLLIQDIHTVWQDREKYVKKQGALSMEELTHFISTVAAYKDSRGKMDYTDILEQFLLHGVDSGAHYVIVDEAQDLSPLQWAVVRKLSTGCRELHIAGDDDQAIHEWNGARPGMFITHPCDSTTVLPQSYRIPGQVHALAEHIAKRIKTRLTKVYRPREEQGQVTRTSSLDSPAIKELLTRKGETTFILVRNHGFVPPMADLCRQNGVLFKALGNGLPEGLLDAVRAWTKLAAGEKVTKVEVAHMYAWMSTRDRVAYGSKGKVVLMPEAMFDHAALAENYGLVAIKSMPWAQALDKILPGDTAYIKAIEAKGTLLTEPVIEIATIHAVKGKEADNVIIVTDMSGQTHQSFEENPDAEHRVWYVGVTRAKKSLMIVTQNTRYSYNL